MEIFTGDVLRTLVTPAARPSVTLVAPVRLPHERSLAELQWKELIDEARRRLEPLTDRAGAERSLAGAESVLADGWPTNARSVVYVGSPLGGRLWGSPVLTDPTCVVGDHPALALLGSLVGSPPFLVLALGLHDTRLLSGDAWTLHSVDLGVPGAIEDAVPVDERGQHSSRHSGGPVGGHGLSTVHHGADDASTRRHQEVEAFVRQIDRAVWRATGPDDRRPLVVVGVDDLVARLRAVSVHPDRIVATVDGSADRRSDAELHAAAVGALTPRRQAAVEAEVERFRARHGSGLASDDPDELAAAAAEGRIEVLLVPERAAIAGVADDVAAAALNHGGAVLTVPDARLGRPAAVYRW